MTLQRVVSKGVSCSGCCFHMEEKTGGFICKQLLLKGHVVLDCADFDAVNPTRLVFYIFKESCDEKQNETMAP